MSDLGFSTADTMFVQELDSTGQPTGVTWTFDGALKQGESTLYRRLQSSAEDFGWGIASDPAGSPIVRNGITNVLYGSGGFTPGIQLQNRKKYSCLVGLSGKRPVFHFEED